MRKRYRKRIPVVEAEQFRPDFIDGLPEGVEESLTPGKYLLRFPAPDRKGGRHYIQGVPIKSFDFIVRRDDKVFALSQKEFEDTYEEC